jgi:hypothetical protein
VAGVEEDMQDTVLTKLDTVVEVVVEVVHILISRMVEAMASSSWVVVVIRVLEVQAVGQVVRVMQSSEGPMKWTGEAAGSVLGVEEDVVIIRSSPVHQVISTSDERTGSDVRWSGRDWKLIIDYLAAAYICIVVIMDRFILHDCLTEEYVDNCDVEE